nr:MAG TPA: hypothetical protein [Caudoviricetes sp.]
MKFLTHLWYNISMGQEYASSPTTYNGGELPNRCRTQNKNAIQRSMFRPTLWISH